MLSPHPELSPELRTQSALQSLTYNQMRVASNCLWNLFVAKDRQADPSTGSGQAAAVAEALNACTPEDELVCQTVYNAFVNCVMSLEAAHKVQKG